MNDQLTVLVKKADGTSVRVPVSSLLSQTATAPAVTLAVTKPEIAIPKPVLPVDTAFREEIKRLVPPTPAPAPLPKAEAMVKKVDSDFHTSLLEEAKPTGAADLPLTSSARPGEAEAVMRKLSFTVPANLQNRLRSLIQLCLKDVRTSAQTVAVAERSVVSGGLGLAPAQAKELSVGCAAVLLPVASQSPVAIAKPLPNVPAKEKIMPIAPPPFKLSSDAATRGGSASGGKKPMHDIVERTEDVGPIDEIRLFTLTDLRRLSSNPSEAATRLKQKFTNLREESILFYLEALNAWQESALYRDYITTLAAALSAGAPLTDNGTLTLAEITALARMNQTLLTS